MKLVANDLACVRGGRTVFEGLAFTVKSGSSLALHGANGTGKSSLLRMLAGFLPAVSGSISLDGGLEDTPLGEQCHYVGHLNGVKRAFTVRENLEFWRDYLGGVPPDDAIDKLGLEGLEDIPAKMLSAGQSRRLGLARLLIAARPLWLLDEPSVSLDADSRKTLSSLMRSHLRSSGMIVAATHDPLGIKFSKTLTLGGR